MTLLIFAALCLAFAAILGSFAYWPAPEETSCMDIPEGTVAIAIAFSPAGKDMVTEKYLPGLANKRIAEKLEECAGRFRIVLTQKAVSDAMESGNKLKNGVPVEQMHKDTEVSVRTLEAVCCAIERLHDYPENLNIGLIAHDKHFKRSRQALEAVLQNKKPGAHIADIHLGMTPYQDDAFYRPWVWAARELLLAWPAQYLLIKLGCFQCSDRVAILDKLSPNVKNLIIVPWQTIFILSLKR